ncbi:GntR family transcriptional regulator [Nocardioides sp. B-3]|uniref:GntR family transcriptional regulator n=1 Tax=Nocardioides sp. B-3 TaxID=2895565 RepID=UPI002152B6D0|nr:GntR family transcriptional regulator [Nocardioides sp. B-3]UUZ58557.1 GntR family transcriptional regulator [Nocardioides sp. B-3]
MLRTHITEGLLLPGTRLSEEEIGAALGVSRNTLREAFRLLTHERLLVHEFNRGVFVRQLAVDDVRDLYTFRRIVECGAIAQARQRRDRGGAAPGSARMVAVRQAVEEGDAAARDGRWAEVGTANMRFHQGCCRSRGEPADRRIDAPGAGRAASGLPRHGRSTDVPRALSRGQPQDPRAARGG